MRFESSQIRYRSCVATRSSYTIRWKNNCIRLNPKSALMRFVNKLAGAAEVDMYRMGKKKPARGKYPHKASELHADPWFFSTMGGF